MRLMLVEDHVLVREGMAQTLRRLGPDTSVREVSDAPAALEILRADAGIDLLILDLMLPGMNGFSLLSLLRKEFPALPIIVVSGMTDAATVSRALRQGAGGFVSKASSGDTLLEAVHTVMSGQVYAPAETVQKTAPMPRVTGPRKSEDAANLYRLTQAQVRVLELLAQGFGNREIAERLGLSEGTVKVHTSAIFRALKVSNRSQVLLVLQRDGVTL